MSEGNEEEDDKPIAKKKVRLSVAHADDAKEAYETGYD
jgi:hypothetical protein